MVTKKIAGKNILIVGRANFHKGSETLKAIISVLSKQSCNTFFYESKFVTIQKRIEQVLRAIINRKLFSFIQGRYRTQRFIKKIIRFFLLLIHPTYWSFLVNYSQKSVPEQSQDLDNFIRKKKFKDIIILAHSAGGIVSSRIYNNPAIKKIICLGYPFKHPDKPEEPYRTHHLQHIKKPCLIIEGRDDPYGGEEIPARYALSSSICFKFIEGNHDYNNLTLEDYADVLREIREFIAS